MPANRPAPKLPEVREEEVEDLAVPLGKISTRTIELQTSTVWFKPDTNHVFHPDGSRDLLVELEPVEFAARDEVGVLSSARRGRQGILMRIAHFRIPDLLRHDASRLPDESDRRLADGPIVVGDDIASHKPSKRIEYGLRKGIGALDGPAFEQNVQSGSMIGSREARHG
jgi:hypothetical protein